MAVLVVHVFRGEVVLDDLVLDNAHAGLFHGDFGQGDAFRRGGRGRGVKHRVHLLLRKGGVDSLGFVDFSQQFFQIFFPIFHASSSPGSCFGIYNQMIFTGCRYTIHGKIRRNLAGFGWLVNPSPAGPHTVAALRPAEHGSETGGYGVKNAGVCRKGAGMTISRDIFSQDILKK